MPQYADPSVLMSGRGIQFPDPLELATRGSTFANLYTRQQMGDIELQEKREMLRAMQDPRYAAAFSGGGVGGPNEDLGGLLRDYPMSAGTLLGQVLGVQEKGAKIGKDVADTAKLRRDVLDKGLDRIGNLAAQAAANPSGHMMLSVAFELNKLGIDPQTFGAPPDLRSAGGREISTWLSNVASLSMSPEQRANIVDKMTKLPGEVEYTGARTAQAQEETRLAGPRLATEQYGKTTERYAPKVLENELRGIPSVVSPWAAAYGPQGGGPAGPNPPSVRPPVTPPANAAAMGGSGTSGAGPANAPATPRDTSPAVVQSPNAGTTAREFTTATGEPLQTKMTPQQKAQAGKTAEVVGELTKEIPAAMQAKETISNLRGLVDRGIYSGGIRGSDFFKQIANVWGGLPFASEDMKQTLSNTQVYDTQAGTLVFDKISTMPGMARIAGPLLNAVKGIKVNTLMTAPAITEVLNHLDHLIDIQVAIAQNAASAAVQPGATNLNKMLPPGQPPAIKRRADGAFEIDAP